MSNKIKKLLSVGDYVYKASNNLPIRVEFITCLGFVAGGQYYSFDDVRKNII